MGYTQFAIEFTRFGATFNRNGTENKYGSFLHYWYCHGQRFAGSNLFNADQLHLVLSVLSVVTSVELQKHGKWVNKVETQ